MRFSAIFLYFLLLTTNSILSTTYKLTHPSQTPWPGFFSVFNTVLGALEFYENSDDADGFIVDFEKSGFFYDPNFGENWWEYYFEPIKLGTPNINEIIFKEYKKITFSFSAQLKMSRERSYELINNYIKLKPHIQNKLDAFVKEHFEGETVIGLHYRGTDKILEAPKINYELVGKLLSKEIENDNSIKIFVATDEDSFLQYMYKKFPGRIIALDAIRSKNDIPVHKIMTESPYQKGEDALLDCLLLSKCSKIYKTASNLSDVSIKFNPTMPVINISEHFTEKKSYSRYNFFKVLDTILMLLDTYEKNPKAGFTAYLPTKDANWWEFHFKPLIVGNPHPNLQLDDIDLTIFGFTGIYEMDPNRAYELITKYIEIKPHVIDKVEELYNEKLKNSFVVSIFYMKGEGNDYQHYNEIIFRTQKILRNAPNNNKIVVITDDNLLIQVMREKFSNIVHPVSPKWQNLDGEVDLLFCLIMARANYLIGSQSVYLKVVSQFNPLLPVVAIGDYWLEK